MRYLSDEKILLQIHGINCLIVTNDIILDNAKKMYILAKNNFYYPFMRKISTISSKKQIYL